MGLGWLLGFGSEVARGSDSKRVSKSLIVAPVDYIIDER